MHSGAREKGPGGNIRPRARGGLRRCTRPPQASPHTPSGRSSTSAHQKPDGLTVITPEAAPAFLEALPLAKIFGAGDVPAARFKDLGITTHKPLKQQSLDRSQRMSTKRGTDLHH